jgi:transposase
VRARWAGKKGRRPAISDEHLDGFFFILRTGAPWRDLPARFGRWSSVYSQFRRWCRLGIWDALLGWLASKAKGALRHVDGSYIKLHQHGLQGSEQNREAEAIGLSRGGMTTKLLAAVDEQGTLCAFVLTSGNRHDQVAARRMLEAFKGIHFVGDKGFDSIVFREALEKCGATGSTIPRKGYQRLSEQPEPFDRDIYGHRHEVENCFMHLKAHKRLALRAERTASSLAGFIVFASFLRYVHTH